MTEITLNGAARSVTGKSSIGDLIMEYKLSPNAVIVELNGTVLKAADAAMHILAEGDRVELIQVVGGG